jgi:hypothetical protein
MTAAGRAMLLPLSLGFADGILSALTLASSSLVSGGPGVSAGLALRIAVASLLTAGFAVFVATYSEARGGLRHASHQLSLPVERGLVTTRLGREALRHATEHAGVASAASFVGALLPLLIAAVLPGPGWIAAAVAIAALGLLGVALATAVAGSRARWAAALMIGGLAVTAIGSWIHIA